MNQSAINCLIRFHQTLAEHLREALVPKEKCRVFRDENFFLIDENAAGYFEEPVMPPSVDGAPLRLHFV